MLLVTQILSRKLSATMYANSINVLLIHSIGKQILQFADHLRSAPLVCIDGNLRLDTLKFICQFCKEHNIPCN